MTDTFSIFLGKLLASAVVTALVTMAGIYFVVDMSLRGTESAIETTNKRIDDLRNELTSRIDLKFEALEQQLKNEFSDTRREIKKAELDSGVRVAGALPQWKLTDFGTFQVLLDPKAPTLSTISKADPVFAVWAKNPENASELKQIESSGFIVQPSLGVDFTKIKWQPNSTDADAMLTSLLSFKNCATISEMPDGSPVVVPIAERTIVGRDGIFCKTATD
jgi:hypothetical protein